MSELDGIVIPFLIDAQHRRTHAVEVSTTINTEVSHIYMH